MLDPLQKSWSKECWSFQDANVVKGKAKQQEVFDVYKILPVKKGLYFQIFQFQLMRLTITLFDDGSKC